MFQVHNRRERRQGGSTARGAIHCRRGVCFVRESRESLCLRRRARAPRAIRRRRRRRLTSRSGTSVKAPAAIIRACRRARRRGSKSLRERSDGPGSPPLHDDEHGRVSRVLTYKGRRSSPRCNPPSRTPTLSYTNPATRSETTCGLSIRPRGPGAPASVQRLSWGVPPYRTHQQIPRP